MTQAMVPFNELKELALATAKSGFFAGVQSAEQALVLMSIAQAEGCLPIQAMQRFHVIKGKPSKQAWAMLDDFTKSGGKVEWHRHDAECCDATFSHPQGGSIRVKWDLERARTAGLFGNDMWKKYPENMLHARCVSTGVRFVNPGAANGLYTPEEVHDFDDKSGQGNANGGAKASAWDHFGSQQSPAATANDAPKTVTGTEPASQLPPVDVPFEEVIGSTQTAAAEQQPSLLKMPDDACDAVPAELVSVSRVLTTTPFAQQTPDELRTTLAGLDDLLKKSKHPNNKAAITVIATFARRELNNRSAA